MTVPKPGDGYMIRLVGGPSSLAGRTHVVNELPLYFAVEVPMVGFEEKPLRAFPRYVDPSQDIAIYERHLELATREYYPYHFVRMQD